MGNRFEVETLDQVTEDFFDNSAISISADTFDHGEDKQRGDKVRRSELPNPLKGINSKVKSTSKKTAASIKAIDLTASKADNFISKIKKLADKHDYNDIGEHLDTASSAVASIKKYSTGFMEEINNITDKLSDYINLCTGTVEMVGMANIDINVEILMSIEMLLCAGSRDNDDLMGVLNLSLGVATHKRIVMAAASNEAARRGDLTALNKLTEFTEPSHLVSDSPDLPFHMINGLREHYRPNEVQAYAKMTGKLNVYGTWGSDTGGVLTRGHVSKKKLAILQRRVGNLLPVSTDIDPLTVHTPTETQYLYNTLST